MKPLLAFGPALGILLFGATSSAAITTYKAALDGTQQIPPHAVPATGNAVVKFDDQNKTLVGTIEYIGLSGAPTGANFGIGACGTDGTVALPLTSPGPTQSTVNVTLSDAQITALQTDQLYVTIHTAAHPDGEIRGQFYFPRTGKTCPADAGSEADAGELDAGNSAPGADAGPDASPPQNGNGAPSDGGGCSTTGNTSALLPTAIVGFVFAFASIVRRKRRAGQT